MDMNEFSQHLAWVQSRIDKLQPEPETEQRNPRFMWEETAETLSVTFEELRVAEEEIRRQGEELEESRFRVEEEQRRYRELFDLAPIAYLVTDPAGIVREANRAAGALLNVDPTYLAGKPLANFVAMGDRAGFRLGLVRLGQSEPAADWAVRIEPRRGAAFDATLKVSIERDWGGTPVALRWTIHGQAAGMRPGGLATTGASGRAPTLRAAWLEEAPARAPEAAEAEATRLRALLDGVGAVIWEADPETRDFRFLGRRIEALLGFPAGRWEDEPGLWAERLHPDDRGVATAWRERCFRDGESGPFEYRLMAADGRAVWVLETITVERDEAGAPRAVRGLILDLGRRKKVERKLYSARRALADRLADVSYLDELTGRLSGLLDPGRVASEVLSAVSAVVGAEVGLVRLFDGDRSALEAVAALALDSAYLGRFGRVTVGEGPCGLAVAVGGPVVVEDLEAKPVDARSTEAARVGGYRAAFSVPLKGRGGELFGTIAMFFREAHRPPERQVRLVEHYARRAADALDVARQYRAAREADRRKDELLATLAHELRTPLAAVNFSAQALRVGAIGGPAVAEAHAAIVRHAGFMARMVEDLLDASRIGRGTLSVRTERVDAAEVVARAVEATRPIFEARRHELSVALPSAPVHVEADPTRLEQVLVNLLNNAAGYTDPGGRIALIVRREGDALAFRVRDTGVGLTPEAQARIFELFDRADAAHSPGSGGLGIGLALVKSLVELHGGAVAVTSEGPGRGSEFVVHLPLAPGERAEAEEAGASAVAAEPATRPMRLLVVDDEPDSARALARLLRFWGHEVRVAHDARTALEEARRDPPELVLLDLGLPGTDGFEVARRLLAGGDGPRVFAMTGHSRDVDQIRAVALGFEAYLVKPVDPGELGRLLGKIPGGPLDERHGPA